MKAKVVAAAQPAACSRRLGKPLPAGAAGRVFRPAAAVALPCRQARHRRSQLLLLASAASMPAPDSSNNNNINNSTAGDASDGSSSAAAPASAPAGGFFGWLQAQRQKSAELRKRLGALGLAAVLAYGLFDGVSYTIAFSLAFLGYEAQTGLNPTQNVADIVKICILMWAGNNVTRPFRLAGAAALAPFMDRLMDRLQAKLRLKNKAAAFAICVAVVATVCFSILGGLFFSRWIRG